MKKHTSNLIGRAQELSQIETLLKLGRNLLIEGPVGVGKTYLVLQALNSIGMKAIRVDGDTRYSEQKLTGWFDPPMVMKKGYDASCFVDGPLTLAMRSGQVLFINELNRMPEAVQNILLPALDERQIEIPKIGRVEAKKGFLVIATQNPKEFTATQALSEALMDRFEILKLNYQSESEERQILKLKVPKLSDTDNYRIIATIRATRSHPAIKRGASIRAAIAVAELMTAGMSFAAACQLALQGRLELVSPDEDLLQVLEQIENNPSGEKKKLKGL